MLNFLSKIFGGSKSEKDVLRIKPNVAKINEFYQQYQQLTNDQLRGKTVEFRERIQEHLKPINEEIKALNEQADALPIDDINGKDELYKQVDELIKKKDDEIEVILNQILPEAFAVVKETA